MKSLLALTLLIASISSFAQDLFVLKKNMNPKNVLHFKAQVSNGKLKDPPVTAYWVMGEEREQILSLADGKETTYFKPKVSYNNKSDEADFTFGAISEMGNKIKDKIIRVRLENGKPKAFLDFDDKEIQLTEIYVNTNIIFSVRYMIIYGLKPDGTKFKKQIDG